MRKLRPGDWGSDVTIWYGCLVYMRVEGNHLAVNAPSFCYVMQDEATEADVLAEVRKAVDHDKWIREGWTEKVPNAKRITPEKSQEVARAVLNR